MGAVVTDCIGIGKDPCGTTGERNCFFPLAQDLAKWLAVQPTVLIVDEPTRGVDIGTKAEIYALFDELVLEGIAILVISSDLPEVLALADRILIMRHGQLTGELSRNNATEEKVMHLAALGTSEPEAA